MKKLHFFIYKTLIAQIIVIFLWFSISVMQWMLWPNNPGIKIPVIIRGIDSLSIFTISWIYIFIWEKVQIKSERFNWKLGIIVFIAIYLASIAANLLSVFIKSFFGFKAPAILFNDLLLLRSTWFFIPLVLSIGVFVFFKIEYNFQTERENKLEALSLAQQAKWMMLRYQVNPHFLFNALNTIRALIGVDDNNARKIVTEMSEYFRYSLSSEEKYTVTVEEEINAALSYLEIQKIRFQEKIKFETKISEKSKTCLIPVFSIQTLVENAVKYGLKTSDENLKIIIECSYLNGMLDILVKNSGFIVNHENGESTSKGISNLKNRLNHLYPSNNTFSLFEKDGIVIAHVSLKNCLK